MMRDGNFTVSVTMTPEDEWRGSEIREVLPDGYLLAIQGRATGSAGKGRIEASGTGGGGRATVSRHQTLPDAARATCT